MRYVATLRTQCVQVETGSQKLSFNNIEVRPGCYEDSQISRRQALVRKATDILEREAIVFVEVYEMSDFAGAMGGDDVRTSSALC